MPAERAQHAAEAAAERPASEVLAAFPAPVRLWLRPVQPMLEIAAGTSGKPLGQLTMPEVLAWGYLVAYGLLSGMIAGRLAANLAVAAVRGPYRR